MKKKRTRRRLTPAEVLRDLDIESLPFAPPLPPEKEPTLWELFLLGLRRTEIRFTPREGERFVRTPTGLRLERIPRG